MNASKATSRKSASANPRENSPPFDPLPVPEPLPTEQIRGTFDLMINYFRPLGGMIPISAQLSMPLEDQDPRFSRVFRTNGKNITINLKDVPPHARLELCFRLPANDYLLIGIAFASSVPTYDGQVEFPVTRIETKPMPGFPALKYRQMIVTDDHALMRNDISYDYVIIVQSISTGEIGIIDPDIETEATD